MSQKFKKCLERGRIKKFSRGKVLYKKELKLAHEDLKIAKDSFKAKNYKWSIIQTYYSMFHSARALLYKKNYREKSHFCLIEAIRTLYVEENKLSVLLLEGLIEAKNLREAADYYGDYSKINAEKMIKKACNFLDKVEEILK